MDRIGDQDKSFQIVLNTNSFNGSSLDLTELQIMSLPKRLNYKWYHVLLNKITFGYLCPSGWSYKVKMPDDAPLFDEEFRKRHPNSLYMTTIPGGGISSNVELVKYKPKQGYAGGTVTDK